MKCPHTDFRKGQKIVLTMRDGSRIIDRFVENKSGVIITRDFGKTKLKDIRATTIFRNQRYFK